MLPALGGVWRMFLSSSMGFALASDKQHLAAFMKSCKRQSFYAPDTANIDDLIEYDRVFANLFPDKTDVHSDFRRVSHYRQLLPKLSKLYDSNFIVRIC